MTYISSTELHWTCIEILCCACGRLSCMHAGTCPASPRGAAPPDAPRARSDPRRRDARLTTASGWTSPRAGW
eukprot:3466756-Pleurochrysis_carterae.AAC.1